MDLKGILQFVIAFFLPIHLRGKFMAIDAYLQIDGIKGESQDSTHQGWIELTSAQWGCSAAEVGHGVDGRRPYGRALRTQEYFGNKAGGSLFAIVDANVLDRENDSEG